MGVVKELIIGLVNGGGEENDRRGLIRRSAVDGEFRCGTNSGRESSEDWPILVGY